MAVIYVPPTPTDPATPKEPENPTGLPLRPDFGEFVAELLRKRAAGEYTNTRIIDLRKYVPVKTDEAGTSTPATGMFLTIGLAVAFILILVKKRKPNVHH